jgi:hypothetical protein
MHIMTLEAVLDEMRRSMHADEAMLRDWERRIAGAITEDLVWRINASFASPGLREPQPT